MLYENYETEISKNNLVTVLSKVTKPLCLLGGWAVYLTVNENYRKDKGRSYHGSKDIDLGFHFSKNESEESLINSAFNQSIKALEGIGFYTVGFRLVQHYHRDTQMALTEEQAKKIPLYDMFDLYVDPMVDNIPDKIQNVLGFRPADEKLLGIVFEKGQFVEMEEFEVKIRIPTADVLLATKLISLPRRNKDHKKWKDVADIYALVWYSGKKVTELKSRVLNLLSQKDVRKAFLKIEAIDYQEASSALGVELDEMKNVIDSFIKKTIPKSMSKGKDDTMNKAPWRIPTNIGYDKFILINKALYQQRADVKPISLEKLASLTSLSKKTLVYSVSFLKSVGILEELESHECKLATFGKDYTKAHFSEDRTLLESTSVQLIKNSHLQALEDRLKINKNMDLKELYLSIKTLGRLGSGSGISGMSAPYAAGAKTILHIFKDANLIPEIELDASGQHVGTQKRSKKQVPKHKPKSNGRPTEQSPTSINESISALAQLTVKGVGAVDINDQDTLELAEKFMVLLKKKIQNNISSESKVVL